MHNIYYVYEWFIIKTDEVFYVGKGCGNRKGIVARRNKFFLSIYSKYDCDVRVIESNLYEDDAFRLEESTIKWYREHTAYRLTNMTDGGDGAKGTYYTPERKRQISSLSKARWDNEIWRQRIIHDRHLPSSTYQSADFKRKMSDLCVGERNPNYGNHWTEEQRKALSNHHKQLKRYLGENNPRATKVKCVETEQVFNTMKEAQAAYHIRRHLLEVSKKRLFEMRRNLPKKLELLRENYGSSLRTQPVIHSMRRIHIALLLIAFMEHGSKLIIR